MSYRLQYAPSRTRRARCPARCRATFDTGVRRPAADPYGQGSTPVKADADRREASVSEVVVRFYISASVLMVSVVRVVHV
ncbi:hypothetical protein ACFQ7W_34540 [Streptomyces niveus]|uniref:hypothetical protein n=1 Tax=Streptomyces niveus TaxID=193462 RepID=UPI0036812BD8